MTYLQFHLAFNLPVLAFLLWLTRARLRAVHWKCIGLLCLIVLAATTPWDNWAVHCGIWSFDERKVTPIVASLGGVRWNLPAEEYLFFVLETVEVALLTLLFLPKPPSAVVRVPLANGSVQPPSPLRGSSLEERFRWLTPPANFRPPLRGEEPGVPIYSAQEAGLPECNAL